MLHVALALDRRCDVLVGFVPNQPRQRVSFGEALAETLAMLIGAASEVSGDAGVERAVRTVRHDVDPAAAHPGEGMSSRGCRKDMDGRDKPGHDLTGLEAQRKPQQQ
jgi:hypothetical protein